MSKEMQDKLSYNECIAKEEEQGHRPMQSGETSKKCEQKTEHKTQLYCEGILALNG